jgi:acyl dehydratase
MTQKHAVITDEMLAELRSRIGVEWKPREPYFNNQVTRDAIRHFCDGIGDPNPLFRDPEYAKKTTYGCIIAPPCFLYSVYWPAGRGGLPGIHAWHSGNDWEFYKPILLNDEITFSNVLTDVVERPSRMAGRIVIQYGDTFYRNQRGELVAKAKGWSVRAERAAAGEKGKYKEIAKANYTPEQLKAIERAYLCEEVRGVKPRYWEDVQLGEALTPVVKGPLSLRDMNAWLMGAGGLYMRAHRFAYEFQQRHPGTAMLDSTTGAMDVPELVHMEDTRAQEIGIPGAYDYGCQRISWLGHLLTNWIGDDGFLKRLYAELRLFNVVGDTTWCKGKVTKKHIEKGEHLVDIECWGENQRGEINMPGRATVRLPSKGK